MNRLRLCTAALALLALASCAQLPVVQRSGAAAPEVERFEITQRGPAFGGRVFEDGGQYEVVTGIAWLRARADDPRNKGIVDIDKVAGWDGWVHYRTNVVILRPIDKTRASHTLVVDLPNRGSKLFQYMVNEGSGALAEADAAGIGYTMRRGHTIAWIGWQGDIPMTTDGSRVGMDLPQYGATGLVSEEAVFDELKPVYRMKLGYRAAAAGKEGWLVVRATPASEGAPVPEWRWMSDKEIEITRPPRTDAGAIYEFRYRARDPKPMGLGFAALRDVTGWLKSAPASPVADLHPDVALAVGISQSGRALRDFIWQGFNAGADGRRVFDGAMPIVAGAKKSFTNYRFALPGRNATQHNEHLTPGDQFPFTYAVTRDPLTGQSDGIFARCAASHTCPQLMHVDSNTEFWQGRASLIGTDGAGRDVPLPDGVRAYLMSSLQHVYEKEPATPGICKYPHNTASEAPLLRALLEDLAAWARGGKEPPPSQWPTIEDVKLAAPAQETVGFPDIRSANLRFPAVINGLAVTDYRTVPPTPDARRQYELLVPMVDEDGHDIAGVRLPDIAVPLATHAGWNLRREVFAENELCGLSGMMIPFAPVDRPGDPRRSIARRYPSRLEYAKQVAAVARDLRDHGFLLQEDVDRYIERARNEARVAP
ncbi:MAG: alpha/beta hydrolase domain-containing protein [Telluria sp.]